MDSKSPWTQDANPCWKVWKLVTEENNQRSWDDKAVLPHHLKTQNSIHFCVVFISPLQIKVLIKRSLLLKSWSTALKKSTWTCSYNFYEWVAHLEPNAYENFVLQGSRGRKADSKDILRQWKASSDPITTPTVILRQWKISSSSSSRRSAGRGGGGEGTRNRSPSPLLPSSNPSSSHHLCNVWTKIKPLRGVDGYGRNSL